MQVLFYIFLALLPAIVLLAFILWRDRLRPEPARELVLACLLGLLSVPIAQLGSSVLSGFYSESLSSWQSCLGTAFLGAAIPEEFGKLLILWVFFRWRRHQNEVMDGIVYAVCIGLVFAAYENVGYVWRSMGMEYLYETESLALVTSVLRALTAVPAHFCFAVIMGFFFSMYMFGSKRRWIFLLLSFLAPALFHGLYDFLAFLEGISDLWLGVITFLFFLVFFAMNNLCIKTIRAAIKIDDNAYELAAKKNAPEGDGNSAL